MPETQILETATENQEDRQDHSGDRREPSPARRAAAIEAAYILEAVRR